MNSTTRIAVSTLAFSGKSPEEVVQIAQSGGYILEFSSGLPYRADMESFFLTAPVKRIPHNYFPAPKIPFVLNLASADQQIRERSVQHCLNGLKLAAQAGAPFFSAHAGFCIDPDPKELGKQLSRTAGIDRVQNWKFFMGSLRTILVHAADHTIDFLIENNVIAQMNIYPDGTNPLLCCDAEEMMRMITEINHPSLGILLDTGHLKVSAPVLKFDISQALEKIRLHVKCIHHSDNDGIFDSNLPLTGQYWFWEYMKYFSDIYHVLEVKKQSVEQVNEQIVLLEKYVRK